MTHDEHPTFLLYTMPRCTHCGSHGTRDWQVHTPQCPVLGLTPPERLAPVRGAVLGGLLSLVAWGLVAWAVWVVYW